MSTPIFDFLGQRRSAKPDRLAEPGPTPDELRQILKTGARVPDHKKLAPWRFIVFRDEARRTMGDVFAKACETEEREPPSPVRLDMERARFLRAPVVVAVVSSIRNRPGVPEWEQILSAGAVCFNTCLAANALGFGTSWISEWIAYSPSVRDALGLSEKERIAGFIYMGQPMDKPDDRERPDMDKLVTEWPV